MPPIPRTAPSLPSVTNNPVPPASLSLVGLSVSGTLNATSTSAISLTGNLAVSGTWSNPANTTVTMTTDAATIDSTAVLGHLIIAPGATKSVKLSGDNLTMLGDLTVSSGSLDLNGKNLTMSGSAANLAGSIVNNSASAASTFTASGTLTLSAAAALAGNASYGLNADFATVDGTFDLTVDAKGGTISASGGIGTTTTALASLSLTSTASSAAAISVKAVKTTGVQDYAGNTRLGGNLTTTGSTTPNVTISGAAILASTIAIDTSAGKGEVKFTSTLDADSSGGQGLTVTSGTGAVTFGDAVGGTKLSSIGVMGGAISIGAAATTADQSYAGSAFSQPSSAALIGNKLTVKLTNATAQAISLTASSNNFAAVDLETTTNGTAGRRRRHCVYRRRRPRHSGHPQRFFKRRRHLRRRRTHRLRRDQDGHPADQLFRRSRPRLRPYRIDLRGDQLEFRRRLLQEQRQPRPRRREL